MRVEECGQPVCSNTCKDKVNTCLIEEVKKLPDFRFADCKKVYRDAHNDLWVITDDGWQQVNKDKNSHVPVKMTGEHGISVKQSGTDDQTITVDGKAILEKLNSMFVNGKVPVPTEIYKGNEIRDVFDFPNYDNYDYVEIEYKLGSTRDGVKYNVKDLKGDTCHIYASNMADAKHTKDELECFTKLVDGDKFIIEKYHALKVNETGYVFEWGKNDGTGRDAVIITHIVAYKYEDITLG